MLPPCHRREEVRGPLRNHLLWPLCHEPFLSAGKNLAASWESFWGGMLQQAQALISLEISPTGK